MTFYKRGILVGLIRGMGKIGHPIGLITRRSAVRIRFPLLHNIRKEVSRRIIFAGRFGFSTLLARCNFDSIGLFFIPMAYADLLKDPRWQKKRLQILNRDEFTCRNCGLGTKTLHVHHKVYFKQKTNPWDYPDNLLVTLCEECHAEVSTGMADAILELTGAIKKAGLFPDDIKRIARGFNESDLSGISELTSCALMVSIREPSVRQKLMDLYFGYMGETFPLNG